MRYKLRNKLTGIIFGKYDLKKIAKNKLVHDEKFVSGLEIIYYNEIMIFISIVIGLLSILFTFKSLFAIIPLIISMYLIFLSLELELIFLTDERIIIEKRGILEKILNTQSELSLSLDQIAVLKYSRAPFHRQLLYISLIGLIINFIIISVISDLLLILFLSAISFVLFYMLWFGLRLNKRSIELSVIGINLPVGIGRSKGAPMSFLVDIQEMVFERIHHISHSDTDSGIKYQVSEFPLQFSSKAKAIIEKLKDPFQQHLIKVIDQNNINIDGLYLHCHRFEKSVIDKTIQELKHKNLIVEKDDKLVIK